MAALATIASAAKRATIACFGEKAADTLGRRIPVTICWRVEPIRHHASGAQRRLYFLAEDMARCCLRLRHHRSNIDKVRFAFWRNAWRT